MKYKNIGDRKIILQAGASAEAPHLKKFYEIEAGQTIEIPVLITRQVDSLIQIDEGEMRHPKKKKE
jgi:hypothetical protein